MRLGIQNAIVSFRIGKSQWGPDKGFRALVELFEKYKGLTDEVTFITSETHAPLAIETMEEHVSILTERMAQLRPMGYKTGINILATIGHHNENLPNSFSADYTRMTDMNGNICWGSFCPNDEGMRTYIKQLYTIVTGAQPDYMWIDDDVRFGHMPIGYGCFCDNCLLIFEKEFGVKYTRETIRDAFNTGSTEQKLEVRMAWLQHNRNTIARLFEMMETTVHRLKPDLPLGFMTGDRFLEGYDFHRWAEILSGNSESEVMWRPGGGFYSDDNMRGLAGKSHDIGRQVSMLPDSVVSIQSEIENFPYQRLQKSAATTALEAASHIAAGCTGAAFNVLSQHNEPLDEYEPLLGKLRETRPFYDLLVGHFRREKPMGIYTGWGRDVFAVSNIAEGDWFAGNILSICASHADEMLEIGLPAAYSPEFACVTALSGDTALAMKDEQVLKMLASGVYMDAKALMCLNEMGYGEFTGFEVERFLNEDCIEEFTDHPLNAGFSGRRRDARQSFLVWLSPAAVLKPVGETAKALARIVDYTGREVAACCMGIFENQLGGRICVAGYYPWKFLQSDSKSSQLKFLMRWLSKDTLAAYVSSFHKINMWVRTTEQEGLVLAITNSCLDRAEDVTLMLRTTFRETSIFDMRCAETLIRYCGADGPYHKFVLPAVEAWDMRLVVAQRRVVNHKIHM